MGQVCTKGTAYAVSPNKIHPVSASPASQGIAPASRASPASRSMASASPLGSRQRNVAVFSDTSVCTRIDITKTKLDKPTTGNENLVCDFAGGSGCFVCDIKNIKSLIYHESTVFTDYTSKHPLDKHAIYESIQAPESGLCVKIFFETDAARVAYETEAKSYDIFKTIAGAQFPYLTTYGEYTYSNTEQKHAAFRVDFGDAFYVYINGKHVKRIRCILFKRCNASLHQLIRENKTSTIPLNTFFNNIGCMLQLLHQNGYTHMDIKPENIVFCKDDAVPFKLIDYNLKKYANLETPVAFTGKFLLPLLHQEIIYKKTTNVSFDTKKMMTKNKAGVLYYPDGKQMFLIDASNKNYTESMMDAYKSSGYEDLYYKSDEYALAMTLLEIYAIDDERKYNYKDNKPVKDLVEKLIAAPLFFKAGGMDATQCKGITVGGRRRVARSKK